MTTFALAGRVAAVAVFAAAEILRAGSPELQDVQPAGVQRGVEAKIVLRGARLAEAQQLHFYEPGIEVRKITNTSDSEVLAECAVASDCAPGEHHLRLRTACGLSELRTLWVGVLPVVNETEPNSDFDKPQKISLNCTIAGIVGSEDIDYFAVEARKGQRITAEIEGLRLGRTMFDPAIAIQNAKRFELAASDDSSLLLQDGVASAIAPDDGTYIFSVREASFGGSDQSCYRLHVGTYPRPLVVYPPGAGPGQKVTSALLGDPAGPMLQEVQLPNGPHDTWVIHAGDADGTSPSPNWLRVSVLPTRSEPVSGVLTAPLATAPVTPAAPVAFEGIISAPGEVDSHRFSAKEGQALAVQCFARRLRSPLDSIVDVFDGSGKWLSGNDDAAGADSVLAFTAPADGEIEVRVRDHLGRGGSLFVYRIEIDSSHPSLGLSLERMDSKRPQFLQAAAVPKGNRFALLVRTERQDAVGPVELELDGLPPGIAVTTSGMDAESGLTPLLLEAKADAATAGSLCSIRGRIKGANGAADLLGCLRQTIPLVISAPNDTVYYQTSVDKLAVAVTEPAPFKVELAQPGAPLVQNGSKNLKVAIERATGFAGEIVLQMLWNPPGVSSALSVVVPANQSQAVYPLNASSDALLKSWKICLLARASVNGGDVWISSGLVELPVAAPFFAGTMQMAAAERGRPASVLCKLEPRRAFEGKAKVTLLGLPPSTSCTSREISTNDKEVILEVAIGPDAPLGQHASLFCELTALQAGEEVTHRLAGGGVLRIDAPPVAVTAVPPPLPAASAAPAPAPPRPLSRLEQLRKAAAEKAANGTAP